MAKIEEFFYPSANGINRVHAVKVTPENGQIKGVVQIAHGIAEHIGRYEEFMCFLADNGFAVFGNDHLGHGKSYSTEIQKGFFALKDGWNTVVKDMVKLHDIAKEQYPEVPYIMFGHSMGSFLTRTYIIDYPDKYDLAILSGTGHQGKLLLMSGCAIANLLCRINGENSDGKALNDIAFGSYLNKIPNAKTPFDWLSTVDENVRKYINDENCGFVAKTGLYRDMMNGIKYITDQDNINKMCKEKPVYFMSGSDDPVGDYGKGVEKAYNCFKKACLTDVKMRIYPNGRHEMLNESNKEQVYKDILDWINAHI